MSEAGHSHPDNGGPKIPVQKPTDPPLPAVDEINRESGNTPDESPSMSRSSSKASSIDAPGKPPKPRRPTNYTQRKSSISQRGSISSHIKELSLNPQPLNSSPILASPPVSAAQSMSPSTTTITPRLSPDKPPSQSRLAERQPIPPVDTEEDVELDPYFPLPPPGSQPEVEVPKASAVQMYWHQPPMHGMMRTGPTRRSHSIAQIGSQFFLIGGSDGKTPKATNSVYIFDAGNILLNLY